MQKLVASLAALIAVSACGGAVDTSTSNASSEVRYGTTARLMPLAAAPVQRTAASAKLVYFGGKVLPNVKVYSVNWGSTVNPAVVSLMASFYTGVTNSPYFDWLSEYSTVGLKGQDGQPGSNQTIGRGSFGGTITLKPSITSTTVDDSAIQKELAAQIAAGVLPAPDNNSYYAINFPKGITITQGSSSSCVQFCAYHGTFLKGTQDVYYGVLPSLEPGTACSSGCGNDSNYLNNVTSVASHEMIETVTDGEVGIGTTVGRPLAWYDSSNGEIGDICNAQQGTIVGGDGRSYVVQAEWDNQTSSCITQKAGATTDFTLALSSATLSASPGGSATVTVSATASGGSSGTIALQVSGLPAGVNGTFSPASVKAGGTSTLTLTVSASAASGTSSFTVTGKDGSGSQSASANLTVGSASTLSNVTFQVDNATTFWGQNVYVVGSTPDLGSWDPTKAIKLSPTAYPTWTGTLPLLQGESVEFKFIDIDGSGNVVWENGANRTLTVPHASSGAYTGSWQN